MNGSEVSLAAIALAGSICAGFFALVNKQVKIHGKIAVGLDRLAAAHEKGNRESAERNGHLGELVTEQTKFTKKSTDQLLAAVKKIPTQHIDEQRVEHQTVRHKE
jgi:hypothetical protein